jgi:hypothetical protein
MLYLLDVLPRLGNIPIAGYSARWTSNQSKCGLKMALWLYNPVGCRELEVCLLMDCAEISELHEFFQVLVHHSGTAAMV